jgi:hypothetical protein
MVEQLDEHWQLLAALVIDHAPRMPQLRPPALRHRKQQLARQLEVLEHDLLVSTSQWEKFSSLNLEAVFPAVQVQGEPGYTLDTRLGSAHHPEELGQYFPGMPLSDVASLTLRQANFVLGAATQPPRRKRDNCRERMQQAEPALLIAELETGLPAVLVDLVGQFLTDFPDQQGYVSAFASWEGEQSTAVLPKQEETKQEQHMDASVQACSAASCPIPTPTRGGDVSAVASAAAAPRFQKKTSKPRASPPFSAATVTDVDASAATTSKNSSSSFSFSSRAGHYLAPSSSDRGAAVASAAAAAAVAAAAATALTSAVFPFSSSLAIGEAKQRHTFSSLRFSSCSSDSASARRRSGIAPGPGRVDGSGAGKEQGVTSIQRPSRVPRNHRRQPSA